MNHLSNSISPYLLQHANNPVDWHPWSAEALEKARAEDKPIFLSIGYAACHWCHVMAHESFEDPETAAFMNEHFINIKVDREERPDLDGIYMQAVVAMTGSGGWPMSVFLAPDLKPFYSGTYFPPVHRYNLPSFKEVLSSLAKAWREDRREIEKVGKNVHAHLQNQAADHNGGSLSREELDSIAKTLHSNYDWGYGGWGDAPKFPQPMVLEFLLHNAVISGNKEHLDLIQHCLDAMARGGMYDVVGGGFARYSTDQFWRIPHFEKMAYDNALLVRTYLHAWQVTRKPAYKRVVVETLEFVTRELTGADGGFYSSLDADSEGVEGKFYAWTLEVIQDVLKDESEFFEAAYGITTRGNWEGKTILQRALDDSSLAARFKLDPETVPDKLADAHTRLLSIRDRRRRPATDDKVLTAWNGLMLAAFSECARVFNDAGYYEVAARNAKFLLSTLRPNGELRRAWRTGKTTNEYFLEDYAALILGLLELYQADFDIKWFASARELTDEMIEKFSDPNDGGFFDTPNDSRTLLLRPRDPQDNATPSGNSLACEVLIKLAAYTGEGKYLDLAERSLSLITDFALNYPLGFGRWLAVALNAREKLRQIAILGETGDAVYKGMLETVQQGYYPDVIIASSPIPLKGGSPKLLRDRPLLNGRATAYVCKGFVCNRPVTEVDELITQLRS